MKIRPPPPIEKNLDPHMTGITSGQPNFSKQYHLSKPDWGQEKSMGKFRIQEVPNIQTLVANQNSVFKNLKKYAGKKINKFLTV